jgi:hypothetical protein
MSFEKARTSDRFQILTAVLFMTLFAAALILISMPKGNLTTSLCRYFAGYEAFAQMCLDLPSPPVPPLEPPIAAEITMACLDSEGLRISVALAQPLTGSSSIQVFTTGEDYFPSDQGISDSFRMNLAIPGETDHLDLVVPVDSMPVGEQIFGNIVITDEGVSSFVAYSMNVSDCSVAAMFPPDETPHERPIIRSATCLPSRQLMIAFEFDGAVFGQYRALVAGIPYRLASVINQPATLFFSGEPPPEGPAVIRLVSATDEATVFEEAYTPPVCGIP